MGPQCVYCQREPAFIPPDASNAGINLHNAFSLQYGPCHLWLVESPDEIVQKLHRSIKLGSPIDFLSSFFVFSFLPAPLDSEASDVFSV